MGVVYLGEHAILGRRAAIKLLLPEFSHNAELVDRFFKEARATALLRHHAFVEVFDSGRLPGGSAYLVMEMLDGESLGSHLARRGSLPVVEATVIASHIAEGVGYAHRHGIVHRDLKPDNVFLARNIDSDRPDTVAVKVLDFGIAKLSGIGDSGSHTRTGAIIGTPLYMAPEQCRGAGRIEIDHRADIYALGCILHAMIAGKPPFALEGFGEIIAAHLGEPPTPLSALVPEVPPAVEKLVLRLLAKRVDDRPASMDDVARELDGLRFESEATRSTGRAAWAAGIKTLQLETVPRAAATASLSPPSSSSSAPPSPGSSGATRVLPPPPRERTPGTLTGAPGVHSAARVRPSRRWLWGLLAIAAVAGAILAVVLRRPYLEPDATTERDETTVTPPAAARPPGSRALPAPVQQEAAPHATVAPVGVAPGPADHNPGLSAPAMVAKEVTVDIDSSPADAEVLDAQSGVRLGQTPLRLLVPKSDSVLRYTIRKAGFRSREVELSVEHAAHARVTLERRHGAMVPAPTVPSAPSAPPADDDDDERRKL